MSEKLVDEVKIKEVCDIIVNNLDESKVVDHYATVGGYYTYYTISNKKYDVDVSNSVATVKDKKGNELFYFWGG